MNSVCTPREAEFMRSQGARFYQSIRNVAYCGGDVVNIDIEDPVDGHAGIFLDFEEAAKLAADITARIQFASKGSVLSSGARE
jgi:hypothetical protein